MNHTKTTQELLEQASLKVEAMKQLKDCYDDQEVEIHGRKYQFTKTTHEKRKEIYAYYTVVAGQENDQWITSPEFRRIQAMMNDIITVDGYLLSKCDYWNESTEDDFMDLYKVGMAVISYPFLPDKNLSLLFPEVTGERAQTVISGALT